MLRTSASPAAGKRLGGSWCSDEQAQGCYSTGLPSSLISLLKSHILFGLAINFGKTSHETVTEA